MQGKEVAHLFDGPLKQGTPVELTWAPTDLPVGFYLARLTTDNSVHNLKLILKN